MKQSIITVATAAALTLACGGAKADAYGTAQLSNFRISLYDIDLDDNVAPSLTFATPANSLADITGQTSTWPASDPSPTVVSVSDSHTGTGAFGPTSARAGSRLTGGDSSISGSLETTFAIAANSYALGDPISVNSAYAEADLGGAASAASFWLSPGTVMVINATIDLAGRVTGLPGYESGGGAASILVYGNDPFSQSSSVSMNAGASSFDDTGPLHRDVKLTFANDGDTAIEGFLQVAVSTSAFSQMDSAASVPEPSAAGLMLLGLGALVALARRKRMH